MSVELKPGDWGRITCKLTPDGTWEADGRYRTFAGNTVRKRARGESERSAREALVAKFESQREVEGVGDEITAKSTVAQLASYYLETRKDRVRSSSITTYRSTIVNQVLPVIGDRRIAECRASVLAKVIKDQHATGKSTDALRKVLSGMFQIAAEFDMFPANPVANVEAMPRRNRVVEVLSMAEIQEVRALIDADMRRDRPGPHIGHDLRDLVDILLATGCRVGEASGLLLRDIDLTEDPPRVTVTGTIKNEKGKGTYRQPSTKSRAGWRTLLLPQCAVDIVLRRMVENPPNDMGALFPTRAGTWRQDSGWERMWNRVVDDTPYAWVTFHTFRRSVATLIREEVGLEAAQMQLGHENARMTETYVATPEMAPDLRHVLQLFGRTTS